MSHLRRIGAKYLPYNTFTLSADDWSLFSRARRLDRSKSGAIDPGNLSIELSLRYHMCDPCTKFEDMGQKLWSLYRRQKVCRGHTHTHTRTHTHATKYITCFASMVGAQVTYQQVLCIDLHRELLCHCIRNCKADRVECRNLDDTAAILTEACSADVGDDYHA